VIEQIDNTVTKEQLQEVNSKSEFADFIRKKQLTSRSTGEIMRYFSQFKEDTKIEAVRASPSFAGGAACSLVGLQTSALEFIVLEKTRTVKSQEQVYQKVTGDLMSHQ
jgi:hypothetical protein